MNPPVRAWIPTLAAAAAGVALGWLLAQGMVETQTVFVTDRDPTGVASSEAARSVTDAAPARLQGSVLHATEADPAAAARASASSAGGDENGADDAPLPLVEVHVRQADGTPGEGFEVYALPVRASGHDDDASTPLAYVDALGVARLLLPAEGLYDVGVSGGIVHALATDVPSSAGRVDLTLPKIATVDFVIDDTVRRRLRPFVPPPKGEGPRIDAIQLAASPVDDRPSFSRPGRDQGYSFGSGAQYTGGDVVPQAWMPEGRPCRLAAHARFPLRVEPDVAVPPATVRVVLAGCALALTLAPSKGERTFDYDSVVSLELRVDGQVVSAHAWRLAAGQPCSTLGTGVRVVSPVDEGRLEWSGESIVPGSTSFRAAPDGEAAVQVTFDLTAPPRAPPVVDDPPRRMRVRFVPPAGSRVESISTYYVDPDPDEGIEDGESEWNADAGEGWGEVPEGAESVLAFGDLPPGDDDVLELVAGPSRGAHDGASLTLVRGGFLVVVPERPTPPGLHLTIHRADGLPFRSASDEDTGVATQAIVLPGMRLGPLQPGTARFALRLSGVPAGEVSGQVVAGEYRPLFVPVRRAPR